MFNSIALGVVIGLVFIYLLYSLFVTIIQELLANRFSYRAKFLEKAIIRMLEDCNGNASGSFWTRLGIQINEKVNKEKVVNNFARMFYDHSLIKCLGEKPSKSKPSYLDSGTFAKVMIDILRGGNTPVGQEIRSKIQTALVTGKLMWKDPENNTKGQEEFGIQPQTLSYLNSIWTDAQGDVERFREVLENWFNEMMDRTTGWYKKYTQLISIVIGLVISIIFNVDTIEIAHRLSTDPELRKQIVEQADAFIKSHPNLNEELKVAKQNVDKGIDTATFTQGQKDSFNARKHDLDKQYADIARKRDALINQATELVQNDLDKTNHVLGLGLGSYQLPNCKDCNKIQNFGRQILYFLKAFIGWIITALALSLGAPFWFDLLNKVMKLRGSVPSASGSAGMNRNDPSVAKLKRVG